MCVKGTLVIKTCEAFAACVEAMSSEMTPKRLSVMRTLISVRNS